MEATQNRIFMPELPNVWDLLNKEDSSYDNELNQKVEEIFVYLSNNRPPVIARTRIPEFEPRCWDMRVLDIFGRLFCNPFRICKDATLGCFTFYLRKTPENPTYVTYKVYYRMADSDTYFNRNNCILFCFAPVCLGGTAMSACLPFSPPTMLYISTFAACYGNLFALASAGCLTYDWSGNFGTDIALSYEEMKQIYQTLNNHLIIRWNNENHEEKVKLQQLCKKILDNANNILQGMLNSGLTQTHVNDITLNFFDEIKKITKEKVENSQDFAILNNEVLNPNHIYLNQRNIKNLSNGSTSSSSRSSEEKDVSNLIKKDE